MRLILMGPPGSGKGTQGEVLCERFNLEHVATGKILRKEIHLGTPRGLKVKGLIDNGQLAPDELMNEIIGEMFEDPSQRPTRFLFDGYPRTPDQANVFEAMLQNSGLCLSRVVVLKVDEEEIVQRIAGRRICSNDECAGTFHLKTNPPKVAGICDICGAELTQREDDKEETVRTRFEVYHQQTEALTQYYRERCLLSEIEGTGTIDEITNRIVQVLETEAGSKC